MQTSASIAAALLFAALLAAPAGAVPRWTARLALSTGSTTNGASIRVAWRDVELLAATKRIETACGTRVLLDRRVDPSLRVTLSAEGSARRLVEALASELDLGVAELSGVFYLGPRDAARDLPTLHAKALSLVAELPRRERLRYTKVRGIEWPRLATPQQVLNQACTQAELRLANPDSAPHDLWPAGGLPPAPLAEQLTLLLAGLGLEWSPGADGEAVVLGPLDSPPTLTALHTTRRRVEQDDITEQFRSLAPEADVKVRQRVWVVRGRLEHHLLMEKLLLGKAPAQTSSGGASRPQRSQLRDKRFTLNVKQQPAGPVLRQLATAVGLRVEASCLRALEGKRVTFRVEQATIEELLAAVGEAAGVSLGLEGETIVADEP